MEGSMKRRIVNNFFLQNQKNQSFQIVEHGRGSLQTKIRSTFSFEMERNHK